MDKIIHCAFIVIHNPTVQTELSESVSNPS
jgi:hypothetical protein